MLLAGCATSSKAVVPPDLPPLPAKLEADCNDPGVPDIDTVDVAIAVIISTRLWAVCEKKQHHGTVDFYKDIRIRLRAPNK